MVLGIALLLTIPVGTASHLNNYATNPVEHDDQGRSVEPDFAATSVLGVPVENRIYDPTPNDPWGALHDSELPPTPPGHRDVVAPGCTDDSGRRPSGTCGLLTIGVGAPHLGVPQLPPIFPGPCPGVCIGVSHPPGRFSLTRDTVVRFLDALQPLHLSSPVGGVQYIELNRKLDDLAAPHPAVPEQVWADHLAGPTGLWAWYGLWRDLNANGVIDELWPSCSGITTDTCPPKHPGDEWTWLGNCFRFPSGIGLVGANICEPEPTTMLAWVFPGNHHATGAPTTLPAPVPAGPSDFPGRQAICAAEIFLQRQTRATGSSPLVPFRASPPCPEAWEDLDAAAVERGGDPLLDDATSLQPDVTFADRSGDPQLATRQWVAGNGFSMYFYDESVLSSTVIVTAILQGGCGIPCAPARVLEASSVDVDVRPALHPALDLLVGSTVKPALRSQWVAVRGALAPVAVGIDGLAVGPTQRFDPLLGMLDPDPGYAHEPNTALDQYPAIVGRCQDPEHQYNGWCTDYRAYASGPRGWVDAKGQRVLYQNVVLVVQNNGSPIGVSCILCVAGGGIGDPVGDGTPKGPGTPPYARALAPGGHLFSGNVGRWHDRSQVVTEEFLDPGCAVAPAGCEGLVRTLVYTVGPDAWIGNIINTTGYFRYRGFTTDTCPINGPPAEHPYAWCHPYRDGVLEDPNAYGGSAGEFLGACVSATFPGPPLTPQRNLVVLDIIPLDASGNPSTWHVPTFVERDFFQQRPDIGNPRPWLAKLEDWTGKGPIRFVASCAAATALTNGAFGFGDLLVLPSGNLGQAVRTEVRAALAGPGGLGEVVVDADTYVGWGH